ncbi:MAG: UvrD-helicase domain-containing protein [Nitrospinae bacterium]|nr:UvrD-helicase domain-containing protein [Nitrospinota bacterium]
MRREGAVMELNPRQQEAVAFQRNTVVNASAGTGKTATIVGAYLARLAEGFSPGQILAITFTEKAAAEMRERLKQELLEQISHTHEDGGQGAYWRRMLTGIANAPISTIHAFCGSVLKENPLEAGVDPHFSIWDEDESSTVRRAVILDLIQEHICAGHPGVQALFRDLQLLQPSRHAPKHLTEVVEAALRWLNGLGVDLSRRALGGRNWLEARFAAYQEQMAEIQAAFEQGCREVRDVFRALAQLDRVYGKTAQKLLQRLRADAVRLEKALASLSPSADADAADAFDELAAYLKPGRLSGDPANDGLRACLETLQHRLGEKASHGGLKALFGALKSEEPTQHLVHLVGMAQAEYTRRKTDARSLDFDDLLIRARDLLKLHSAVRRRYKSRFRAILVDEFQDTDDVQGEIICLIAEHLGREQEFDPFERYRTLVGQIELDPHRLFIVGDPKQSIYRFRRADVRVFVSMAEKIVWSGGTCVALVENYRSTSDILTFANTLFSGVMDGAGAHTLPPHVDTRHRIHYSEQDHLLPGKPIAERGGLVLLLADAGRNAELGRALEAKALAALIEELHNTDVLTTYRDAAILLKTRSFGQLYEDALRARGIPYYMVKGGGFFQRQEVSDLTALLSFLADPGDDLALAQVLTSPFAGLDFADLYQLCEMRTSVGAPGRASPLFPLLSPARLASLPAVLQQRLTPFAHIADRLLQLRDRLDPAELLDWAIRETGYDAVLMAQEEGEQRVANLAKVLDLARSFSRKGLAGLHEFVEYLTERLGEDPPRTPDAQILGEEEDVVRIMTIHQAKGLEFEAVFVPDLAHRPGGERGSRVVFDERWGVICAAAYGINRAKLPHPHMLEAELVEQDKEVEEQKRLLYVALTRAKRILVMGEGCATGHGLWRTWVMRTVEAEGERAEIVAQVRSGELPQAVIQVGGVAVELRRSATLALRPVLQSASVAVSPPLTSAEVDHALRRVWDWSPPRPHAVELSPTALATLAKCVRYFFLHEIAGLEEQPPGQEGGLPAVDRGRIVHGVLESVEADLPAADIATRVRELMMREPGAPLLTYEEFEELARDLEHYLQSSAWQALMSNPTLQREVPFSLLIKGDDVELSIRGRMDAVAMRHGVPVVVDHKYARFDRYTEAGYEVPMAIYVLAAMRASGSPRAEVGLNFLRTHVYPTETQTIDAAHRVEARLLRLAEDYVTRRHESQVEAWPRIQREQCELARCGFRPLCWGRREEQ